MYISVRWQVGHGVGHGQGAPENGLRELHMLTKSDGTEYVLQLHDHEF